MSVVAACQWRGVQHADLAGGCPPVVRRHAGSGQLSCPRLRGEFKGALPLVELPLVAEGEKHADLAGGRPPVGLLFHREYGASRKKKKKKIGRVKKAARPRLLSDKKILFDQIGAASKSISFGWNSTYCRVFKCDEPFTYFS